MTSIKKKYYLPIELQQFNDEETVVEEVHADGEQESQEEVQLDDRQQNAFMKKVNAERAKFEAEKAKAIEEVKAQYKDYDTHKLAAEHLMKTSGINDIMTLKEELEYVRLQERAEESELTPAQQKKFEELEAKANKGVELEERFNQQQANMEFESKLKEFCEGKEIDGSPLDPKALWQFMSDNETVNMNLALKAMKADALESKIPELEKNAVKGYLAAKQGVKVDSGGSSFSEKPASTARERLEAALKAAQNQI